MDFQNALTALKNNNVEKLELNNELINEASVRELCSALATNTSLKTLQIEDAGIDEPGALAIAVVLAKHPAIERLILDENPLTSEGAQHILMMYQAHSTLRKVSLAGANANKLQRKQLADTNKARKKMKPAPSASLDSLSEVYRDKISKEELIMAEPVVATKDGHTYELEGIMNYLGYQVMMTAYGDDVALQKALTEPPASQTWHLLYEKSGKHWYLDALDVSGERQQGRLDELPHFSAVLASKALSTFARGALSGPVLLNVNSSDAPAKAASSSAPSLDEVTDLLGNGLGFHRWCQYPTHNTESPNTRESLAETGFVESQAIKSQIESFLSAHPALWHDALNGVYLPESWQWRVLFAIKAGDSDELSRYWSRHPGLVTRGYVHLAGDRVHRAFIEKGSLDDFQRWMMLYDKQSFHATVPSLGALYTLPDKKAGHVIHQLIANKRGADWYQSLQSHLGYSGDCYHGLLHLHSDSTHQFDATAINSLIAENILPHTKDDMGRTPLVLGIQQAKYAISKTLLPYSDINSQDNEGNTALHYLATQTASSEQYALMITLLSRGINDTLANKNNQTAEQILEENVPGHYGKLMREVSHRQRNKVQGLKLSLKTLTGKVQTQETDIACLKEVIHRQSNEVQGLKRSLKALTEKVQSLETDNAHTKQLSVKREKRIRKVPTDVPTQKEFFAPGKNYIHSLFIASSTEIKSVEKTVAKALDIQDKLVSACKSGDLLAVQQLHQQHSASFASPNRYTQYPGKTAIKGCHWEIIEYILKEEPMTLQDDRLAIMSATSRYRTLLRREEFDMYTEIFKDSYALTYDDLACIAYYNPSRDLGHKAAFIHDYPELQGRVATIIESFIHLGSSDKGISPKDMIECMTKIRVHKQSL